MKEETKKNNKTWVIIVILLIVVAGGVGIYFYTKQKSKPTPKPNVNNVTPELTKSSYQINSNSLENFDLYFLKLENELENKAYSPLSIKYALEMLEEGANGKTKEQIKNIIGTYRSNKYLNSKNMTFANALFIKDTYKDSIQSSYIDILKNKYDANVEFDDFSTTDHINDWVSKKTFNLINNMFDDVSEQDFVLLNSLGIDMEWIKEIQNKSKTYEASYPHINYKKIVGDIVNQGYHELNFEGNTSQKVKSVELAAVANKYDIIKELGEENIRKKVTEEYNKWLKEMPDDTIDNFDAYLDKYIEEIKTGYNTISSSTDFRFYVDDNVKTFAKELKQYNGTTLEYIGVMPIKENLNQYINNVKVEDINNIISNLKDIRLENFKEGVLTEVYGYIPMFKIESELDLVKDLNNLGIINVFDKYKADLSNITNDGAFINSAKHKVNFEFSNEGIKAAAATAIGGLGDMDGGYFNYKFDIPVEKIDLTFDKPFMFLVRDKDSGEVWFMGTVYEPIKKLNEY